MSVCISTRMCKYVHIHVFAKPTAPPRRCPRTQSCQPPPVRLSPRAHRLRLNQLVRAVSTTACCSTRLHDNLLRIIAMVMTGGQHLQKYTVRCGSKSYATSRVSLFLTVAIVCRPRIRHTVCVPLHKQNALAHVVHTPIYTLSRILQPRARTKNTGS